MKVVALAGGVGGAKMVDGLAACLSGDDLTVIVNTGDDFIFSGLSISPDIDTVCYSLAGIANEKTGWGQKEETWRALDFISRLDGPSWFRLGDGDIGLHLERTRRATLGQSLSQITRSFCQSLGIDVTVMPMSDDVVSTMVNTIEYGELPFQDYFVRYQCKPEIKGFRFKGIEDARPTEGCLDAIEKADYVVFCPSNPWVSIDPILNIPFIHKSIKKKKVIAVSPLIGGKAVKGPAAKMYQELGITPSSLEVARHYRQVIDGFVLDKVDHEEKKEIEKWDIDTFETDIIMVDRADRKRLAREVLEFCNRTKKRNLK